MLTRNRLFSSPLALLQGDFDRLLNALPFEMARATFPALNVWEDADRVMVEAELPGFRNEEIDVSVVGDQLTIRGQRTSDVEEKQTFYRRERTTTEFERTVTLPYEIDSEKVDATIKDGVLTLTLPKTEAVRARRINVRNG